MNTKTLDYKGRVSLGSKYAGQTVVIDDSDPTCISITPVELIPAREAWLYKNQSALGRVRAGLDDARQGAFSTTPPDVDTDVNWLADVED